MLNIETRTKNNKTAKKVLFILTQAGILLAIIDGNFFAFCGWSVALALLWKN
jgi:hypothetical protein